LGIDTKLLEILPVAVYITDANGFITFYNEAAAEFWGQRPELHKTKWSGSCRFYTVDGEEILPEKGPIAETLRTGEPSRIECITERPDGTRIHTLSFPSPLKDGDGNIIGAINLLTDDSERHQRAEAFTRLAAIVSSSDDAIVTKTLSGRVTTWNKSATRIFGWEEREMIGQPITKIIPPELWNEETRILARIGRGEHIDHYETVRLAKDGRRVDVSLTVSPLHDRAGKVIGASKVARDISEKKRTEEMQQLLLGELNHRVKNTLAIVQSIATQTLHSAHSPQEFAKTFSGRVQALARAHTLFTRDAWQGTDIHDLVREQLLLNDEDDNRISFSGTALALEPQSALSLSMILHELGTNARKYGALSVPGGQLSLTWDVSAPGEPGNEPRMTLQWVERGGPLVHSPLRHGFGSTLIEKGLKAHGGEASIQYDPKGLICEISLPLPKGTQMGFSFPVSFTGQHAASPARESFNLGGKRILVIEDEPLVSMDIEACLSEAGSAVVGPAASVARARQLIESETFDAALVDANLGGETVEELAEALAQRNIPFLFLTGYGRDSLPEGFRDFGIIGKPYTREQLLAATDSMLAPGLAKTA